MNKKLPQVCVKCHKLKLSHLGRFIKNRHSYSSWHWLCTACDTADQVPRLTRHNESHAERIVRYVIQRMRLDAVAEYKIHPYVFDFCLPRLRTLLEIDGKTYHKNKRSRDAAKTKHAAEHDWNLIRLPVTRHLDVVAELKIRDRMNALGM